MSLFSKIVGAVTSPLKAVGGLLGGSDGGSSGTSSNQTANTTNVTPTTNISLDLKPLADVLVEGQKQTAAAALAGKAVDAQKSDNFYAFLENSKKGLWIVALGGGFVYLISRKDTKK